MDDLIPNPSTDVDRRVNDAYRRALRRGKLQWLHLLEQPITVNMDPLVITETRPDATAVAVSPEGWAMIVARGADVPWNEEEPP